MDVPGGAAGGPTDGSAVAIVGAAAGPFAPLEGKLDDGASEASYL